MTPADRVDTGIRDQLAVMESGEPLPSVRALAQEYETSTTTVAKAIARLVTEGLVTTRQGWGVFKA